MVQHTGPKTVVFTDGTKSGSSTFIVTSASLATPTVNAPALVPSGSTTVNTLVAVSTTVSGGSGTPTGTVQFQVKIGAGAWTDIGSAVALVSGGASTSYTPLTADSYQFQAIYGGDGTYNGATSGATPLTVSNAAPVLDHFTFTAISDPQTTGVAYSITITAIDQYGATFTGYTGNPTLTSTSWTGTKQLGAFTLGTKTGPVTSTNTGSTSITATDGSTTGTSNTFTVSNAATVAITITSSTTGAGFVTVDGNAYYNSTDVQLGTCRIAHNRSAFTSFRRCWHTIRLHKLERRLSDNHTATQFQAQQQQ